MSLTGDIGRLGEAAAMDYLIREGFMVEAQNWRMGHYELDLVARKGDVIHFVEVKCRLAGGLTTAEDALTKAKFNALIKAVKGYISYYRLNLDVQIDLIAVDHSDGRVVDLRYIPDIRDLGYSL